MTWISDVLSDAGPGAALAAAVYGASVSIERDARPEAKRDMARFLANLPGDVGFPLIARQISTMFCRVFGTRQLSRTCVLRSISATFSITLIAFSLGLVNDREEIAAFLGTRTDLLSGYGTVIIMTCALSILPDYLALWKTRFLIRGLDHVRSVAGAFAVVAADVLTSLLLMIASMFATLLVWRGGAYLHLDANFFFSGLPGAVLAGYGQLLGLTHGPAHNLAIPIFFTTTILTSIWTSLIFVSALLARVILQHRYPVRVLSWLYDADQHAIRIVGMVMAAILWIACLAISLA